MVYLDLPINSMVIFHGKLLVITRWYFQGSVRKRFFFCPCDPVGVPKSPKTIGFPHPKWPSRDGCIYRGPPFSEDLHIIDRWICPCHGTLFIEIIRNPWGSDRARRFMMEDTEMQPKWGSNQHEPRTTWSEVGTNRDIQQLTFKFQIWIIWVLTCRPTFPAV